MGTWFWATLLKKFQSTPPRRGRRSFLALGQRRREVSIHAPAQGATANSSLPSSRYPRFNPRPRAGGDLSTFREPSQRMTFQSTPPRRGRRPHASSQAWHNPRFNPRPRAGGDVSLISPRSFLASFNPRPRAGGDHRMIFLRNKVAQFQSTPPRRGRPYFAIKHSFTRHVSIHAPAQGATRRWEQPYLLM